MGLISSDRRAQLRQLKIEFDDAYALVDPTMDRSDPICLAAEQAYREWRRAIDRDALLLLDDLEIALSENLRLRQNADLRPESPPSPPLSDSEVQHLFEDIDALNHAEDKIDPGHGWDDVDGRRLVDGQ